MPKTRQTTAPAPPAAEPEPLWTDQDVSLYFHNRIAVRTLANWRAAKKGPPFIRTGKGRGSPVFYRPSAVAAWAADQEQLTVGEAV